MSPLFLIACDDGSKECSDLYNDPNKRSLAPKYCLDAAKNGNAESQMLYGTLLLEENPEEAMKWLEKSAGTNAEARFLLGEIHQTGQYSKKDLTTALFYYRKGCELNHLKSCERVNAIESQDKTLQTQKLKDKQQKEREEKAKQEQLLAQQKLEQQQQLLKMQQEQFELEKRKKEQQLADEKRKLEQQKAAQFNNQNSFSNLQYRDTSNLKFFEGLAAFKENGLYGFVNASGAVVIPPQFSYAGRFSRGRSAVQSPSSKLWGFVDTKGRFIVHPKYCALAAFSESDGLAGVYDGGYRNGDKCVGGKWGFMDVSGNWVIDPVLDYAERFIKGKAKVTYNGETGYINRYGRWVQ